MAKDRLGPGYRVTEALLSDNSLGHAVIEVEYAQGTITLRGTVEFEEARLAAEALALEQEGVERVVNKLKSPIR